VTLTAAGPATVLVVDDRPENLVAMRAVLDPLGYRVLTAESGDEALRHLLTEDVSLILLDVRMPGMSGLETAQHVKQRQRTADIPIVFLTAFDDDSSLVAEGFSTGAVDWLTKPVDGNLLRSKVRVLVDLHERSEALRSERAELAQRLDAHYAAEARNLRRLADAALAINSTQTLDEMLAIIKSSATEVTGARAAEATLGDDPSSALEALVWRAGATPLRMSAKQVEAAFASYGALDVPAGHPALEGWLAVPLVGRTGRRLGIIQVADKIDGDFSESDEVMLLQLAQLAAVAIENAERYAIEHAVAQDLQRVLLPASLPSPSGFTVAARYRPGAEGTQVGGDWYDVVPLADGRVVLTIGDVMGRGARAAAVMGQLRTALHAYALQDMTPPVAMRSVDMLLQDVSETSMATAVYLVVDPVTGRVEGVSAGHPPPVLVGPDGKVSFLDLEPHPPLGVVDGGIFTSSTDVLLRGSTLILYTDGLIEDRETGIEEGLAKLAAVLPATASTLDGVCEEIIAALVPAGRDDDVAVLAVRID
jgi:serine phosphatase RsbU (regulator of sigma subunit)/DNA-binding response OmpR family regulator